MVSQWNVIWELKEFVEIVNNVIIPHFKAEEIGVYPEALRVSGDKDFITGMYEEHNILYDALRDLSIHWEQKTCGLRPNRVTRSHE